MISKQLFTITCHLRLLISKLCSMVAMKQLTNISRSVMTIGCRIKNQLSIFYTRKSIKKTFMTHINSLMKTGYKKKIRNFISLAVERLEVSRKMVRIGLSGAIMEITRQGV